MTRLFAKSENNPGVITHAGPPDKRMQTPPSPAQQKSLVDAWNKDHQPGAAVIVRADDGSTTKTRTRSQAELLNGRLAVIWLEGFSACYALHRITPDREGKART